MTDVNLFQNILKLMKNILTHKGIEIPKPFKCSHSGCDSQFEQKYSLRKHLIHTHSTEGKDLNSHTQTKRFACDWPACEYRTHSNHSLTIHMTTHTGDKKYCCSWTNCGKKFTSKNKLNDYMRLHTGEKPFVCDWPECGKRFYSNNSLKQHIQHSHGK